MNSIQALFDAARRAASSSTWSRGVELARGNFVRIERAEPHEIQALVSESNALLSHRVALYPEDEDWECDCETIEAICIHVAATAICVRRSEREGSDLPTGQSVGGRIRYALTRHGRGLALEREIVRDERVDVLETTLSAIASGRVSGPTFVASPADLDTERALGSRYRGVMPREVMAGLFEPLSRCPEVLLDGEAIEVSAEPLVLQGHLEDAPNGYRLWVEPDPEIREAFDNETALKGRTLHPVAQARLTGRERAELPGGRLYHFDDTVELVTRVLPDLRQRIPVEIHSTRLPETVERVAPRLQIDVERAGDTLRVFPTLVYGDPATARVDGDRLVPLQGPIPIRDSEAENHCRQQLRNLFGLEPGRRSEFSDEDALEIAARLENWDGALEGDGHASFYRAAGLDVRLDIDDAGFAVAFESPAEGGSAGGRADPEAVFRAWREGHSLVALEAGGFAPLPLDWLERFGPRVANLLAARRDASDGLPATARIDLARLCDELQRPRPSFADALAPLLDGFETIPVAAKPQPLHATLRPYQERGIDWLCFLRDAELGALLADDMGLGKTLQALAALRGRSLVVAPTSVLPNWSDEIEARRPDLRVGLYHGADRQLEPEADITLTSYAVLRRDVEKLREVEWDCAVLDEAQNVKNPESQVAQAAFSLNARFRLALSGTPVENRLDELWSHFNFLNPGLLGDRRKFSDGLARQAGDGDAAAIAQLRERIRPFVLRRRKSEVAVDLPPRTEVVLHVDLLPDERAVYDALRAATRRDVVAKLGSGGNVLAALEALLRLRQAACHADLVPGQHFETSSKVELLKEKLAELVDEGHKALVFSQWTSLLDRVEPHLASLGLHWLRLDGATTDRGKVVRDFQTATGPPILLISLKAGGTGLNLTAADHVFLLDPWWNPAVEEQAADRAHRIGQTRPVVVHRLVAQRSVEEGILALQQSKRALSDTALGGAGSAASLTREDLLALLD